MEEENMQATPVPSSEAQTGETVITAPVTEELTRPAAVDEQNGNSNQANANKNNVNSKNNNRNNNFNGKNKKLNNRRRKRSYRSRKNSRSGNNFKFMKNRDVLFNRDQVRRHQLFFSDSQRLVPYNTNEFLMEDHYPKISPNFNYNPSNSHDSFSSSDCGMSGSIDEDEFLTKEFRMDYENLRSEQLHDMTKDQLIQEYLKLENQTELSIKAKENEILALNNKIKDLTRRLKHKKSKKIDGGEEFSSHSDSSSSDSDSSSSDSSSSSSDSEVENGDVNYPVITDSMEQPAPIAETVSC